MKDYYKQEDLWNRQLTIQERERIDIVKKFIPSHVETILDAGCGNGAISNYLQGFNLTALDKSPTALRFVKNKVVKGSIDNLPFIDNSFDLVICSDVLEHLQEKEYYEAIKELKRVAKQYILIISPNAEDLEANQCKCYRCNTVFHVNWHIRSVSVEGIPNNFREEFVPVLYSFFGEKWASAPTIKYKIARKIGRGYKYWENAICPMCGARQSGQSGQHVKQLEDSKYIDLICNTELNGFYNKSTEFIILLSTIKEKRNIFNFDKLNNQNIILLKNNVRRLYFVNRQYIILLEKIFIRKHTEFYPQHAYWVDNDEKKFNHKLVCFPYTKESKRIYFEYKDCINTSIQINVCDLEKGYITIGTIKFINDNKEKISSFKIPQTLVPLNEGLVFEIVFDFKYIKFEKLNLKKIYIDSNSDNVLDKGLGRLIFCNRKYYVYKYNEFLVKNGEFLFIEKGDLIYDKIFKCFYLNLLNDTFEFFNMRKKQYISKNVYDVCIPKYQLNKILQSSNESIKQIKKEIEGLKYKLAQSIEFYNKSINQIENNLLDQLLEIKEENRLIFKEKDRIYKSQIDCIDYKVTNQLENYNKYIENNIHQLKKEYKDIKDIKKDFYNIKEGLYTISNNLDDLMYKLRHPLEVIRNKIFNKLLKFLNKKKQNKYPHTKSRLRHLLIITPDVKIDRRTIQMCKSIIRKYNIKCTILAAFEDRDDFITDKLKVKRIFPNKTKKYSNELKGWKDNTNIDFEKFYWLHFHYLYNAMQEEIDYIMCCDLPVLPAGVYVSKLKNIPLIYDSHELYPEQAIFERAKRDFYSYVEREFIKYPNLIITVNESISNEISKRYNVIKPKVILNAIDSPYDFDINRKYNHFRNKLSIGQDQKIVLFQGAYAVNRNLEILVKSAKYIDNNIVIILMGFGEYERKLKQIAQKDNTLNIKVFFFPAVNLSVLLEYSASADVGIIPYPHIDLNSYFCTPNKLFEFIQAGLPIIANDSPELNRFIIENNIGFTNKIQDEYDIAKMINLFFSQHVDYKNNLLKVRNKFSWSVEEKKFLKIVEDILTN